MKTSIDRIKRSVQVNLPFRMKEYYDFFIENSLNPEIGIDASCLDSTSRQEFAEVARRFGDAGLRVSIHGPFMDLNPGSSDSRIIEVTRLRFEELLDAVDVFRPVSVVCHAGFDEKRNGFDRIRWIETSIETFRKPASAIADLGSRLVLENVYEKSPDQMLDLLNGLDGVGFCLDTGHQRAFGSVSLESWLDTLGDFLAHVHLHDNNGDADSHLAPGKGAIDFLPLFEHMAGKERKPLITLEPHDEKDLLPALEYLLALG